jgi:CRP/FNR family transcriptional regulator
MISRGARKIQWLGPGTRKEAFDPARLQESGLAALEESFLGAVPAETLKQILRDAYPVSLRAGTRVEFNREVSAPVCLVLDGLLSAYISAHGRQAAVRYNRRGTIFGIVDLVAGPPPWSTNEGRFDEAEGAVDGSATRGFVILADSTVLVMNADKLRAVALTDPVVSWKIAREVTRVLYSMVYELSSNVFGNLRQRLAHHLLEIATWDNEHGAPVARVGQQDLADLMGTVREVVTRTMGEFRREGLVERIDGGLVLRDPVALHALVQDTR